MPWYFEKRKAPKAVPGAARKTYGLTWWGQQWLKSLADIDYSNRLPRGKTYANNGFAHDLEMNGNTITAKVTGSMPKPYQVRITVPAFDEKTKAKLLKIVTENPLFLSKLLNRELPPELNQACLNEGIHIFPRRWDDLNGSCSCPDWAVPCKHMAAVLFLIANEIDKNPFNVFELHKYDLMADLQKNGHTGSSPDSVVIPELSALMQVKKNSGGSSSTDPSLFATLDFSTIPDIRSNLFHLLAERPVFYPQGDFKTKLESAYKKISAAPAAKPETAPQEVLQALQNCESSLLLLSASDGSFLSAHFFDAHEMSRLEFESVEKLAELLVTLPTSSATASSPGIRALHLAYRLAEILASKGAFVPQILRSRDKAHFIRYVPALLNADIKAACEHLGKLLAPDMLSYLDEDKEYEPTEADRASALLSVFLGHIVQKRTTVAPMPEPPVAPQKMRRMTRVKEKTTEQTDTFSAWFFSCAPKIFDQFEEREYPKSAYLWLSRFFIADKNLVPVFEVADLDGRFEVAVSIENKSKPFEAPVPLEKVFSAKKYAHFRLDALRDLSTVSEFFPALKEAISSKGTQKLRFDSISFAQFFFEALPVIRMFGIKVLMPKALQKLLRPSLSMSLTVANKGKVAGSGLLSFANMIDFNWQVAMGDKLLDPAAFMQLVRNMRGIVRLADGYAFVDEKEIASLMDKIAQTPPPTGLKLLQIAITGNYQGNPVSLDESAQALIADLMRPDAVPLPAGLQAVLRPYQLRGFEWLYKNTRLGFGSLIADDMGLGKTLQVIATLLRLKEDGALGEDQKALIVLPTTLLTNWSKEIARFAPTLRFHIYHGPQRNLAPLAEADVLLSTYGVVRSEIEGFQKREWKVLVIDEAQNIKNLDTAQTKAVKKLKAPVRIAMTGTPVENRLSEYFSIFDFANHGYLGNLSSFLKEYAKPIELERNRTVLDQFTRATAPFLLRRVKTDKSIISDLPDKIETDQYCSLTPDQAALYQNIVESSLKAISGENLTDIKRQGLVLKMLTALKQVCNHPAHFLKKDLADPMLSGKTQLLLELLSQILENGEKTLIFTQYREMGDLLVPILRDQLGVEAAFLHGGASRAARDAMVDDFQNKHSAKVLLLSLKAGGTGLNLTAASNVIHFDLWWNPAVEAQATDRAFRIGQHRNVQVHRFITQGTFEEKINGMLQSKKELANLAVSAGEKWVGELSDAELRDLVLLK